ncbi:MAG: hypothetical protein NUW37_20060 [Planctomycetes bacterium]|nr:hypothetical protein [Planctomycetota bacterium]
MNGRFESLQPAYPDVIFVSNDDTGERVIDAVISSWRSTSRRLELFSRLRFGFRQESRRQRKLISGGYYRADDVGGEAAIAEPDGGRDEFILLDVSRRLAKTLLTIHQALPRSIDASVSFRAAKLASDDPLDAFDGKVEFSPIAGLTSTWRINEREVTHRYRGDIASLSNSNLGIEAALVQQQIGRMKSLNLGLSLNSAESSSADAFVIYDFDLRRYLLGVGFQASI